MLGENRAIARLGLERMRTSPRPGIAALLARARRQPLAAADLETVGFAIAPRLNAAGRVGEALDAARLLLAADAAEATELAATLETANATRRDLMRTAIARGAGRPRAAGPGAGPGQEALFPDLGPDAPASSVAGGPDAPALLLHGPWPVGIIGLVAGRLADETRPAGRRGDPGGRRDPGLVPERRPAEPRGDADGVRRPVRPVRGPRGGRRVRAPRRALGRVHARASSSSPPSAAPEDPRPPLAVDLALPAAYVDYALYRDLAKLAPCGPGNPDPLVAVLGLTVQRVRAANGGHTQLVLRRDRDVLDGIAFGRADLAADGRRGRAGRRRRAARQPRLRRPRDPPARGARRRDERRRTRGPREILDRAGRRARPVGPGARRPSPGVPA